MLILRDLFGSWICGTEEHYLRLCQGEDPHRRQRNVIHIHAKIQVLIQFIHAYEYIWINLGIDSNNGYLSKYRYWLNLCIFRKEFGYWIKLRLRNKKKSSNLQKSFRIYHLSVKQNVSFIQLPFYHLTMGRASWPLTRLILRNKLMLHGEYEQTNYNKITKSSMLGSTFDFIGIILKNQPLLLFSIFSTFCHSPSQLQL